LAAEFTEQLPQIERIGRNAFATFSVASDPAR